MLQSVNVSIIRSLNPNFSEVSQKTFHATGPTSVKSLKYKFFNNETIFCTKNLKNVVEAFIEARDVHKSILRYTLSQAL